MTDNARIFEGAMDLLSTEEAWSPRGEGNGEKRCLVHAVYASVAQLETGTLPPNFITASTYALKRVDHGRDSGWWSTLCDAVGLVDPADKHQPAYFNDSHDYEDVMLALKHARHLAQEGHQ